MKFTGRFFMFIFNLKVDIKKIIWLWHLWKVKIPLTNATLFIAEMYTVRIHLGKRHNIAQENIKITYQIYRLLKRRLQGKPLLVCCHLLLAEYLQNYREKVKQIWFKMLKLSDINQVQLYCTWLDMFDFIFYNKS